jgi:hypothetical protein
MILSRLLMVFALVILAYLVFLTMSDCDNKTGTDTFIGQKVNTLKQENFTEEKPVEEKPIENKPETNNAKEQIIYNAPIEQAPKINYEHFEANVDGIVDKVHGAAPFAGKNEMDEGKYATVKYTGLVDGTPGDVIQIEGTDLLTAPLVDNMLYTNSIANTNRNASQDLRGDIPLQFNDTYTPFYSSVIYGAPLSEKQMTIGKL